MQLNEPVHVDVAVVAEMFLAESAGIEKMGLVVVRSGRPHLCQLLGGGIGGGVACWCEMWEERWYGEATGFI